MKSHKWRSFLSVGSLCNSNSDWVTLFFPSVTHTPLHSSDSPSYYNLVSWYPEGRFCPLVGSTAPSVSQHVPSSHEIVEEHIWLSSLKPHHHGQSGKTWIGRCRRHRFGGWWRPPSPGGSSGATEKETQFSGWVAGPWGIWGRQEEWKRAGSMQPIGIGDECWGYPSTVEAGTRQPGAKTVLH